MKIHKLHEKWMLKIMPPGTFAGKEMGAGIWRDKAPVRCIPAQVPGGVYDALLKGASWHQPDHYFLLKDFDSYQETRLRANREYQNPELFYRKCYLNMANAGKFSSDRTIRQYYEEIWSNR